MKGTAAKSGRTCEGGGGKEREKREKEKKEKGRRRKWGSEEEWGLPMKKRKIGEKAGKEKRKVIKNKIKIKWVKNEYQIFIGDKILFN